MLVSLSRSVELRSVDALIGLWFYPAKGLNRDTDRQARESVMQDAHRMILKCMRSLLTSCFMASAEKLEGLEACS
ncbi:MAG: hypothetical protein JWQ42_427 [Edaphobacter sp.]|nr:hypothetical protein [Edaphobacter sp.]